MMTEEVGNKQKRAQNLISNYKKSDMSSKKNNSNNNRDISN